ncbi:MAG: trypsin-like peptidase domain-containing protein [Nitrospirota bacterium]
MKRTLLISAVLMFFSVSAFAEFPAVKVYEKTAKNVVLIIAKGEETSSMIGAGSIISGSGLISTNAHVVVDKATSKPYSKIRVYIKPEKVTGKFKKDLVNSHKAEVVAYDIELDLAILQAEEIPSGTGTIELANPDEIKVGEEAVAIGHPEQGGLWTLTYGRISGEIEDQNSIKGKDVFQTDASVNRGNSGGPLLDKRGYMIGINSNMARLGAGDVPITGVNFAVKASVLKSWLQQQGIALAYGKEDLYKEEKVNPAGAELEMEKKSGQPDAPAVEKPAPPVEKAEPEMEKAEPAVEKTDPVVEKPAAPAEKAEPVMEKTEPAVEKTEPVVEKPAAPAEKAELMMEKAEPVVEKTAPPVKKAEPVIEKAGPVTEEKDIKGKADERKPEPRSGEKYQPYQKSYNYDDLMKAAEEELEDMMEEMRGKIRR